MSHFLVVYYSYTGTSRRVAQTLCEMQSWDAVEITDRHPRAGWTGTLRSLLDSLLGREPDINLPPLDLTHYDAVVLVSPVWAYRLAGPMRSFVSQHREDMPDVAVIGVMGSQGAPHAVAEISELLGEAPLMSTSFTTHEVSNGSFAGRLDAFGRAIRQAKEEPQVLRSAI